MISAHAGFPRLLDSGADFIEIDVRRNHRGVIVDSHDEPRPGVEHASLDQILAAVSARALGLHLDLKEAGYEEELLRRGLEQLPAERIVVTPDFESSVRAIKRQFPRVRVSPADFICLDQKDATESTLASCTLPVWVWTVDDQKLMRRFIADSRIEGLITNRPAVAARLRSRRS